MTKKVLFLSVNKQCFDMIESGEKTEVYGEIKNYWVKRLMECQELIDSELAETIASWLRQTGDMASWTGLKFKAYTHVVFTNGYGDDRPHIKKEIESIAIGKPHKGWSPKEFLDKKVFVIKFK